MIDSLWKLSHFVINGLKEIYNIGLKINRSPVFRGHITKGEI